MEKEIKTMANVSSQDVREFLAKADIKPLVENYKLEESNKALQELKEKPITGAKVLRIS
jgi:propanol-preferring alcohol dehydrogenase